MSIMGMGWMEMAIIAIAGLLIFGPDRLPEVAGQVGKFLRDIRKMTSELTGELERTAGVNDIKKAVQNELAGVKSTMDSATKGMSSSVASATKSATASTAAKATSTAAKSTSVSAAKSSTSAATASKSAVPAKPVASKKDPLADVSFLEEPPPPARIAAAATSSPPVSSNGGASLNGSDKAPSSIGVPAGSDALGRARQRRLAAGYNRRIS
jgi:sec-independent protein translocase protein TatB